ncbi:hypothetical protein QE152_g40087 [Popillia japonica]|uniref:Uncharacterized protein n=1 Tax=Popillia japonica TaxID=7064 RepID=A0AAW1HSX7_POPJA
MSASRKTFALAQLCVRQFSQTAACRAAQTEVASSKFPKLKEGQKLFGADDHQLVHVKAGFKDKVLYQATVVLTIIGLGLCGEKNKRKLPTKRILTTSEDIPIPIVSTHRDESLAQLQLEPIAGPSNVAVTNIEHAHNADSPFVSLSSEEEECNELLLQTKDCNKAYKKVALKLIHYKRLVRSLKDTGKRL